MTLSAETHKKNDNPLELKQLALEIIIIMLVHYSVTTLFRVLVFR